MINSVVTGNTATAPPCCTTGCEGDGGGIDNEAGAALTVTNSTVSGNTASGGSACTSQCAGEGGAVYSLGPLTVTNSTIAGNTAAGGGQVLVIDGGWTAV